MYPKPAHLALVAALVLGGCWTLEPPPDISNIALTPPPRDVCAAGPTPILGLLVVMSHPGNQDLRMLARSTYPEREIEALGFRRVFVLARLKDETEPNAKYQSITDLELELENNWYADVITLDYIESYKNLILKSYAAFKWAVDHCSNTRFIMRADDDTFIDFYSLVRLLGQVDDDDYLRGQIYDHFLAGPFFFTSPRSLKLIVDKANVTNPINSKRDDDDFFTGILADVAKVKRVDVPIIRPWKSCGCCCYGETINSVYECQMIASRIPVENRRKTGSLVVEAKAARKIKNHGRFCYYFGCESFKLAVLWMQGVKCYGFREQALNGKC